MSALFTIDLDAENDRYAITYRGDENIEKVYLSGSASAELIGGGNMNVAQQNDIGAGIHEYLEIKGKQSKNENPLYIVPLVDIQRVKNPLGITPELLDICKKYLNE
jgi:hypothetical protein